MKILTFPEKPINFEELRIFLNKGLNMDFITKHLIRRVLLKDPNQNRDLMFSALDGEKLVGSLIGGYRVKLHLFFYT